MDESGIFACLVVVTTPMRKLCVLYKVLLNPSLDSSIFKRWLKYWWVSGHPSLKIKIGLLESLGLIASRALTGQSLPLVTLNSLSEGVCL